MTQDNHEINTIQTQEVEKTDKESKEFTNRITNLNAHASIFYKDDVITKVENECKNGLKALNAQGGIQEMLAAQMLSIHQLQQQATALANRSSNSENIKYCTNAAIKLANCFTQQANTLSKLQGHVTQKITVEHVDVHSGGQAVVGNITRGFAADMVKK